MELLLEHAVFLTATICQWKLLLKSESYKQIIIDSLRFLVKNNRIYLNAFVIMDNHIHLIWQAREGYKTYEVSEQKSDYIHSTRLKQDIVNYPKNIRIPLQAFTLSQIHITVSLLIMMICSHWC